MLLPYSTLLQSATVQKITTLLFLLVLGWILGKYFLSRLFCFYEGSHLNINWRGG